MSVSAEEAQMREAVIAWGRDRWPGARVMHELAVGGARIDLAFVLPDHLIGVEIKSSKDVLDRLDRQLRFFTGSFPELWVAFAPRWAEHFGTKRHDIGQLIVENGSISLDISVVPPPAHSPNLAWKNPARIDKVMTSPLLHLLHVPELVALAAKHHVPHKRRIYGCHLLPILARKLTGDQIVEGVCDQMRRRCTGWAADAPVQEIAA